MSAWYERARCSRSWAGELGLNLQRYPVGELLNRIGVAFRSQAQAKKIRLSVKAPPTLPEVNLDPDRMGQVMGNLVVNSLHYTPRGGRIDIVAREAPDGVRISVHNDGPSIDPVDIEHIFDRFYGGRAKPRRREEGTGLGLAIAQSIVEAPRL